MTAALRPALIAAGALVADCAQDQRSSRIAASWSSWRAWLSRDSRPCAAASAACGATGARFAARVPLVLVGDCPLGLAARAPCPASGRGPRAKRTALSTPPRGALAPCVLDDLAHGLARPGAVGVFRQLAQDLAGEPVSRAEQMPLGELGTGASDPLRQARTVMNARCGEGARDGAPGISGGAGGARVARVRSSWVTSPGLRAVLQAGRPSRSRRRRTPGSRAISWCRTPAGRSRDASERQVAPLDDGQAVPVGLLWAALKVVQQHDHLVDVHRQIVGPSGRGPGRLRAGQPATKRRSSGSSPTCNITASTSRALTSWPSSTSVCGAARSRSALPLLPERGKCSSSTVS